MQDPIIRKRALQLLVFFSTTALNKNAGFMLKVLEHILMTWPTLEPDYRAFNDAIKDLQSESMIELQRLASEMPDHLLVCRTEHKAGFVLIDVLRACLIKSKAASMRCFLLVRLTRNDLLLTEASSSSSCKHSAFTHISAITKMPQSSSSKCRPSNENSEARRIH